MPNKPRNNKENSKSEERIVNGFFPYVKKITFKVILFLIEKLNKAWENHFHENDKYTSNKHHACHTTINTIHGTILYYVKLNHGAVLVE